MVINKCDVVTIVCDIVTIQCNYIENINKKKNIIPLISINATTICDVTFECNISVFVTTSFLTVQHIYLRSWSEYPHPLIFLGRSLFLL